MSIDNPNPQIFMSYSRSEMYYAEGVTNFLQRANFNIWFDLQQLEPGCRWKDDISRGLKESDALILIASRIALASPYVELEWRDAMERGRPIHIVLFEELVFGEYSYVNSDGKEITFDTAPLLEYATTVIDGRSNFQKAMTALVQGLRGEAKIIQKVPKPNRFGILKKLPWAVAGVSGVMLLLIMILLFFAVTCFLIDEYRRYMVAPALVSILVGRELWNFITRKSFGGTRTALFLATMISILFWLYSQQDSTLESFSFTLPLAFISGFAWLLSVMSLGVNRWAPRGQGTRRDVTTDTNILTNSLSMLLRIIGAFSNARWTYKIVVIFLLWFMTIYLVTPFPFDPISNPDNSSLAFITVGILLVVDRIYHLKNREVINRKLINGAKRSFRVVFNAADRKIATTVDRIIAEAGHHSRTVLKGNPPADGEHDIDFYVLVVSNYLQLNDFESLLKNSGRWIILVASSVENRDWHKLLQDFQWVDYRRHNRMQIKTIAAELQLTEYDRVSTGLSSRTTPQSFSQIVVPINVQIFTLFILLAVNIFATYFTLGILFDSNAIALPGTELSNLGLFAIYLPVLLYCVDTVVYTTIRETSQTRINNSLFLMLLIPIYVFSADFAGIMEEILAEVDPIDDQPIIWLMLIASFVVLNRITNQLMKDWAPHRTRRKNKTDVVRVSNETRRELYVNALTVMFLVCVITYSFIAVP